MTSPETSNRREFLQGRAAVDAVAGAIERLLPAVPEDAEGAVETRGEHYLVQFARPAMACQFAVFLNAGQYEQGADAALAALDMVERLEDQLTVYRDTSEVVGVNQRAGQEEVALEPGLFALVSLAVRLSQETGGAFDITSGPLIKVWGFYRRAGAIPDQAALRGALAAVGSRHLALDEQQGTIRFRIPGMELNLGAIGKGYALDRAAAVLDRAGVGDYLLHGGQSSVLARGASGNADGGGWSVGLAHPLWPERRLAEIRLRDRALATSGASHQFFRHQGKRYGHILDPRTGWPADGVLSSTVVAPSAAQADALSTAFYALGVDAAADYCRAHPEVGMALLHAGRGSSSVEVATAGLDAADWRLVQ